MTTIFKKILVALPDDESSALSIAEFGIELGQIHAAQTRLLSVVTPRLPSMAPGIGLAPTNVTLPRAPALTATDINKRKAMLQTILDKQASPLQTDHIVKSGNPSREIVEEADTWGADLIILGARDRNWLDRLLEPPTSQQVAKQTDCAVLILPEASIQTD
jgi:nucleotide-binding universal stress UspA family protein